VSESRTEPPGATRILKIAVFATGCAGIVAEFVLSTLATYLLGNAIFQWTIVMSLMLFAMGLGSRLSRLFHTRLLDAFILIEFCLSILCAVSSTLAYGLAAHTHYTGLVIYTQSFVIGTLIGLEIPLVTRINQAYESLRTNISGVMEKDYYGALFGGLGFAFFALPYLGLTYTPILLGGVNFLVATLLLWRLYYFLQRKAPLLLASISTLTILLLLCAFSKPIIRYGEQRKYRDKVIYSAQTSYQKIVMTRWRSFYWLYVNGQEQFSTFDEEKYHEPLVHPAMRLSPDPRHVVILGGGDGLALREVLKHGAVRSVDLVDIDPVMTDLAKTHPVLLTINQGALNSPKVRVINEDAAAFMTRSPKMYGVIIIDLPDPDSIELMHVYSDTFYRLLNRRLIRGGILAAQATSPYFSKQAFLCILKTVESAGFAAIPYHNQIPTMGEWGWVVAGKTLDVDRAELKRRLVAENFAGIPTRFLNRDAMISMIHFGKGVLDDDSIRSVKINTEFDPVLYRYYMAGSWEMY
jgi:spermidine synthase